MKRVGLLTTSFPRFDGDPAGLFVQGFARALVARGAHVDVLAPEAPNLVRAASAVAPPGVTRVAVPYLRPKGWQRTFYGAGAPDNLRRDPRAWPGLATFPVALAMAAAHRQRRFGRWDALVSHWALPSALVAGAIRGDRPHLAVCHSADLHLLAHLPAAVSQRVADGATALWFVDDAAAARFRTRARIRGALHVSPMGVDAPATVDRAAARRALEAEGFVVLSLGRLIPLKGLDRLIEAMVDVKGAALWIAGDGPDAGRLRALAAGRGVAVRFFGTVSGGLRERLFAAADAFALPSRVLPNGRTEGLPTTTLEAGLRGLPLVLSPVGGLRSCFGGAALYAGDVPALGAALRALRDDEALRRRRGEAARGVAERFTWDRLGPRIEALLAPIKA